MKKFEKNSRFVFYPQEYYQKLIDSLPFKLNREYYGGDINSLYPTYRYPISTTCAIERIVVDYLTTREKVLYRYENNGEFFPDNVCKYLDALAHIDGMGFIYLDINGTFNKHGEPSINNCGEKLTIETIDNDNNGAVIKKDTVEILNLKITDPSKVKIKIMGDLIKLNIN